MEIIEYKRLTTNELSQIRVLWEKLNQTHLNDSIYFKDHYAHFSFEERISCWTKLPEKNFQLLIAQTSEFIPIGYCIATINANQGGEIDSLFIDSTFRMQGIGKILMEKSMKWLQKNHCKPIRLNVSYGHESVIEFYQQFGFYARLTTLELIENEK